MRDRRRRIYASPWWAPLGAFVLLAGLLSVRPYLASAVSSPSAGYVEARPSPPPADEAQIKDLIDSYFAVRYESQSRLQAPELTALLAEGPATDEWLRHEQDQTQIELAVASTFGLRTLEYDYALDYEAVEVEEDAATVELLESHQVVFEAIAPQVSRLAGLEHALTLTRTQAGWLIVEDDYEGPYTAPLEHESVEQILNRVRMSHQMELQQRQAVSRSISTVEPMVTPLASGDWHPYDRAAAVRYADRWGKWQSDPGLHRNPVYYSFDDRGGDCVNYASQVLYAGAPQMDDSGEYRWYYVGFEDRSFSWTYVESLYDYLVGNTWTGPSGRRVSQWGIRPGDLIQLHDGYWWHHVLVAVEFDRSRAGQLNAILINGHSADRYRYPLSFYSGMQQRYVHITGWMD